MGKKLSGSVSVMTTVLSSGAESPLMVRAVPPENAIAPRPVVTDPPVVIETHLAWRRTSINMAKRRFIEASQKVGAAYMAA